MNREIPDTIAVFFPVAVIICMMPDALATLMFDEAVAATYMATNISIVITSIFLSAYFAKTYWHAHYGKVLAGAYLLLNLRLLFHIMDLWAIFTTCVALYPFFLISGWYDLKKQKS